jgi:hypothetical protein
MDWLSTNHSANAIVSWADRPTRERKPTEAEGARWETIVELANTVRRDPWINIPVRANDDYVRNLATLLRDTLDPSLAVYVEYSNELWNGTFDQFAIHRDLAAAEAASPSSALRFDGATDPNAWTFRRTGKRTKEIADIFASVWGSRRPEQPRAHRPGGQMSNSFVLTEGLDVVDRGLGTRPASVFYAISGAPYIFPSATNDDGADEVPGSPWTRSCRASPRARANAPQSYEYEAHAGPRGWYGLKVSPTRAASTPSAAPTSRPSGSPTSIRASARTAAASSTTGTRRASIISSGSTPGPPATTRRSAPGPCSRTSPTREAQEPVHGRHVGGRAAGDDARLCDRHHDPAGATRARQRPPAHHTSAPFGFPGYAQYLIAPRRPGHTSCGCARWARRSRPWASS